MMTLLSEVVPDALSGGAGWLGAGLLGAVLAWLLLVHLPSKDKQLQTMIDNHNQRTDKMVNDHDLQVIAMQAKFDAAVDKILIHCANETRSIREAIADMRRGGKT